VKAHDPSEPVRKTDTVVDNEAAPAPHVDELFSRRDEPGVRDELIEQYLPLAQSLARRYQHAGQPIEDLVQVACIGLINAVDRFDGSRGVSFQSYAVPTILGELKRYHRDRGWSIRVPRRLQEHALMVKNAVPILCQELHRSPTVKEIGDHTGLAEEEVLEALDAQEAYTSVSLDATLDWDGESSSLADRLAAEDVDLELTEDWAEFIPHLKRLPARERRIILLRFFGDRTQSEIADELGISQMHVSRLLSRAIDSLRDAVAAHETEVASRSAAGS
jgi:RNA polymerase sigma-B factor